MKIMKQMILVALALYAFNARAAYSLNVSTPNDTIATELETSPGGFGSSVFDLSVAGQAGFYAGLVLSVYQVDGSGNPYGSALVGANDPFTLGTPTGMTMWQAINSPGSPYVLTLGWSVNAGVPVDGYGRYGVYLTAYQSGSVGGGNQASGSDILIVNIQAVPEPAQVFPVAMLLGCGALVLNNRRRMKKQAA
jgi:hypothetical protein